MTDATTIKQAEDQARETRLNREVHHFFERWAPEDPHEAAEFQMAFHSVTRAIYADMQRPVNAALESCLRIASVQPVFASKKGHPMTAPERMPDNCCPFCGLEPNTSGAHVWCDNGLCALDGLSMTREAWDTRTDIHQAALDRIAELEGELAFYADQSKWRDCGFDCSEPGVMSLVHSSIQKDHGKRAIAVLAKGDG